MSALCARCAPCRRRNWLRPWRMRTLMITTTMITRTIIRMVRLMHVTFMTITDMIIMRTITPAMFTMNIAAIHMVLNPASLPVPGAGRAV